MTAPDNPPVGTPKVTVEGFNPFAAPVPSQPVFIDSNDLNPISEAEKLWLRALAIPPRPIDMVFQALCWIAGPATISSILTVGLVPLTIGLTLSAVVLIPTVAAAIFALSAFPRLTLLIGYRVSLIVLGLALGVFL